MSSKIEENCQLRVDDAPNVRAMIAELTTACSDAPNAISAMQAADRVRYNRWPGQREDGRKPDEINGERAKPWPGGADTRVPLTDGIVLEQVNLLKTAGRKAKLTVRGTEGADFHDAGKVSIYMEYLRNTKLKTMVKNECELAANWRQHYGRCIMSVTWAQEWERVYDTVTLEQLQAQAEANPNGAHAAVLASIYDKDPAVMKELVNLLVALYPDLDKSEAWKQLKSLRDVGTMKLPGRHLRVNEPLWEALMPNRDVIYPRNMGDVQRTPWIAWRRTFTPAQVMEKELSESWSPEFVAGVVASVGTSLLDTMTSQVRPATTEAVALDEAEEMAGLCEVFYFYYTFSDEDGVPCKYRTVISPHVKKGADPVEGPDDVLGYDHGLFPFVEHRRERPDREVESSRGISAITATPQMEKKAMRDARINQTELHMQPPTIRPEREIGLPLKIQPRGEIGERRANATRAWVVANTAPAGEPLEMAAQKDVDGYFARNRAEEPQRAALFDQTLADDWCDELSDCWKMTLQLAQQFEDDVTFTRTVGGKPVPFHATRDDIQGAYDLQLFFNTDQLDPDKMKAKTELLQNVIVPLNNQGVVNIAPALQGIVAYYFPEFADEMLQGIEQAGAAEIKDEQNNWGLMMAGTEPPLPSKGQNWALRAQWLTQQSQTPSGAARLAALPDSRELVERRLQSFGFQISQVTTQAQSGRTGVPALEGAPADGLLPQVPPGGVGGPQAGGAVDDSAPLAPAAV